VNLSPTTVVLSAELLEERVVPLGPCETAGQPDEVPVVVGHADDEDEDDEEDDLDENENDGELDDDDLDDDDFDDDWDEDDEEDEDEEDEDEYPRCVR
jgi:hypothetical protein